MNKSTLFADKASKGAALGILIYLFLASVKIGGGLLFNSSSVFADGLNNFSDIIASLAVFIGLFISHRPKDHNHHFDHNKYETLASFIVALLMFNIGLTVISSGIQQFRDGHLVIPNAKVLWIASLSSLVLFLTYRYLHYLARQTGSIGLKATAADMFNDILITLSTVIGTIISGLGYPVVDILISIMVGIFTMVSAYAIIKDSTYVLSDGFDAEELERFRLAILRHPLVRSVPKIRARLSGALVYVDVVIEIDGNLSVIESHKITEELEQILTYKFGINDTDVHVEPYKERTMNPAIKKENEGDHASCQQS